VPPSSFFDGTQMAFHETQRKTAFTIRLFLSFRQFQQARAPTPKIVAVPEARINQ